MSTSQTDMPSDVIH